MAGLLTGAWGAPARAQCPSTWVLGIGAPGTNNGVTALTVLSSGDVIVGGQFTAAGGVAANYIARVNPTTGAWSTLGAGTNFRVNSLTLLLTGDVAVGGEFTSAGGVAGRTGIARVNPTTGAWSTLISGGVSGGASAVDAIVALSNGDLIVGGEFTAVGGTTANGIARHSPGPNLTNSLNGGVTRSGGAGRVQALVMLSNGDMIVGGVFDSAGGAAGRNNIARLNGSNSWFGLGSGADAEVAALAVLPNGDVIVGGFFTTAGGVAANYIARVNPTTGIWSALGSGTNGRVASLAVLPGGDVLVGGTFSSAGGVATSNIARVNPSTGVWSALGAGTNGSTNALSVLSNGSVLVGGAFTSAGGGAANHIARLTPGANAPSITFQPLAVVTAPSASVSFGVAAAAGSGSTGAPTYQWRKGGVDISTVANPSAATPVLSLANVQAGDVGSYSCLVTNACGGVGTVSNAAPLSFVVDPCPADFNNSGTISVQDIFDFLAAYFAGCP